MIGPEPDAAAFRMSPLVALVQLSPDATPEQRAAIREHLEADPTIVLVEYRDEQQSFEYSQLLFPRQPEETRDLSTEQPPAFFRCTLVESTSPLETICAVAGKLPGVFGATIEPPPRDSPQYRFAWMERAAARRSPSGGLD
jgi:hypothetical protein